jgi:type II secretory pathway component PulK
LDEEAKAAVVEARGGNGFPDIASFLKRAGLQHAVKNQDLDVRSRYFAGEARVDLGSSRLRFASLIQRPQEGAPRTIRRSQGEL